jgi:hypothetical protein
LDRAIKSADTSGGGIQNRVVDDTIPQGYDVSGTLADAGLTETVPGASDLDRILNLSSSGTQVAGGGAELGLAKTVTGGLAPREGESTTGVTRKVEEGFTVYESIISGTDADGNSYSYRATYDPEAPYGKQYYYEVLGSSKPGSDVAIVASTARPDFTQAPSEVGGTKAEEGLIGPNIFDDDTQELLDLINQTGGLSKGPEEEMDLNKLADLLKPAEGDPVFTGPGEGSGAPDTGPITDSPGSGPDASPDVDPGDRPSEGPATETPGEGPGTGGPGPGEGVKHKVALSA